MNRVEQDLSELLHSTTPQPPVEVSMDEVGRKVRRRRRFAAAGTAVAVVAVLASGAAMFRPADDAVQVQAMAIPGVTADEQARILRECDSLGGDQPPGRSNRDLEKLRSASKVYNVFRGRSVAFALVIGPVETRHCVYRKSPGGDGEFMFQSGHLSTVRAVDYTWLAGDLDLSILSSVDGIVDPRYAIVAAGRVSDRVARVRFDGPTGKSVEVKPVNGTIVAVLELDPRKYSDAERNDPEFGTVSAYDGSGELLATQSSQRGPDCYVTPDGVPLVKGRQPGPGVTCKPAVPWKP